MLVVLRSIQLPALTWAIAAIIKGPIAGGDVPGMAWGVAGFVAAGAVRRSSVMHFRQRLALELGEAVVHDLRNDLFEPFAADADELLSHAPGWGGSSAA